MTQLTRRTVLRNGAFAAGYAATYPARAYRAETPDRRPPKAERRFASSAVDAAIRTVSAQIADPELRAIFANCLPNTLDTTVFAAESNGEPDTFIITGDIEAMWLRDSSAQVWPYLQFAKQDPALARMLQGVIRRQARCILIDSYANAFRRNPHDPALEYAQKDVTKLVPGVAERKWEVDSLCYVLRLAYGYWKATGDLSPFDATWSAAAARAIQTFREQQRLQGPGPYSFQRETRIPTDTLMLSGFGNPGRPNGLIFSMFRPSDDACIYPQFVPANLFAVASLTQTAELAAAIHNPRLAADADALARQVRTALEQHGVVRHPVHGEIWAYEVDGYGNASFMDDANSPGLICLPYIHACSPDDARYKRTRAFSLSPENPYFFSGRIASGLGSPHTGLNRIWPLALTMQALTSTSDREIFDCLRSLVDSARSTGFMHESFQQDNPADFTRAWFAWANTIFGELVLHLAANKPALLRESLR